MKTTFNDFLSNNPNCSKFNSNSDAQAIFDFLSKDENIIKMIEASDMGKPALSGCVTDLEAFYDNLNNPIIDFNDDFTRTAIGRMIRIILEPFGYRVSKKKDISRATKCKYFKAASCYELCAPAKLKIVKRIEPVI